MGNREALAAVLAVRFISAAFLVAGCSNSREDVRVTLCKDIVSVQIGSSVEMTGTSTQAKGQQQAAVRVNFSAQGRAGQAVCYYDHDAVEDTALNLSEPLSAFSTSPSAVVIDGRKLSRRDLAEAVKQAMLKQGGELLERAKKGIEGALQR